MTRLHCVLLPGLLLHPPDPHPLPLLQDLPHPEADDGQEEEEGDDPREDRQLDNLIPQLPEEGGGKRHVDEVGSLENGEPADAHLTRYHKFNEVAYHTFARQPSIFAMYHTTWRAHSSANPFLATDCPLFR